MPRIPSALRCVLVCILASSALFAAARVPAVLTDGAFWKMITEFSEPNGYFQFENFMSNEDSYQLVIPRLTETIKPGGVYIGVGPEQNFTYIAALRPKISFIIDIR